MIQKISNNIKNQKSSDIYLKSQLKESALRKIIITNPDIINTLDEKGETILSYALKKNNLEIIDLILSYNNLNLNYKDKNGNSYLHLAVKNRNDKKIETLIKKGINLNMQNNSGNTALHLAYEINNFIIIKLLIKSGINSKIKNKEGKIAKEIKENNRSTLNVYSKYIKANNIKKNLKYFNLTERNENIKKNITNINNLFNDNSFIISQSFEIKKLNHCCYQNDLNEENNESNNKINLTEEKITIINNETDNNINTNLNLNEKNNKNNELNTEYINQITQRKVNLSQINGKYFKFNLNPNKKLHNVLANYFTNKIINVNKPGSKSTKKKLKLNQRIMTQKAMQIKTNKNTKIIKHLSSTTTSKNEEKTNFTNNNKFNNNNIEENEINPPNLLKNFLIQINMDKYITIFAKNGFDDISLILSQTKNGVLIKEKELKEIGIELPGERAKILIRIEELSDKYNFIIPKEVYYLPNDIDNIDVNNDRNIIKLKNWLNNLKIEIYLNNFLNNGYYSLELLLMQMNSNNPINHLLLKDDIGIDKLGHRSRIINKLKEDSINFIDDLKYKTVAINIPEEKNDVCKCVIF